MGWEKKENRNLKLGNTTDARFVADPEHIIENSRFAASALEILHQKVKSQVSRRQVGKKIQRD